MADVLWPKLILVLLWAPDPPASAENSSYKKSGAQIANARKHHLSLLAFLEPSSGVSHHEKNDLGAILLLSLDRLA